MFMQAGFAMVETGFTQAKNAGHTMAMNFMVYALGMLGLLGLRLRAPDGRRRRRGLLERRNRALDERIHHHTCSARTSDSSGTTGFFLSGVTYDAVDLHALPVPDGVHGHDRDDPDRLHGRTVELQVLRDLCVLHLGGIIYPLYANWVWGGGWLSQLGKNFGLGHGHVDFAGSSVVHMVGGVAALAGAMVHRAATRKVSRMGKSTRSPVITSPWRSWARFILAFGWFGFNAGSSLAGTDLRIGVIATNTMLASAGGAFSAMMYMWFRYGKPDISMIANGMLAGLVAITAPCAFVTAPVAVLIGAIAGILVCISVFFVDRTLKIDDPVGAISVHGVNGAWGVISLGLFADGTYGDGLNGVAGTVKGLFYGGGSQFVAQLIGTADEHHLRVHCVLHHVQGAGQDRRPQGLGRGRN